MKKQPLFSLLFLVLSFLCMTMACSEDDLHPHDGKALLRIHLRDAPAVYDEVNIDLRQVMIKMNADSGWMELDAYPGIYDLLALTGGIDTLIVSDSVPVGRIQQLRLILGDANYVVIGGIPYPMDTPSAQQSGLKLNLNKLMVQDSLTDVLIDFDAAASVVEKGNGGYSLKPVLRVMD
jgi:hypothetical protein